jgi:hypothetical protein
MTEGCQSGTGRINFRVIDNEAVDDLRVASKSAFALKGDIAEKTFLIGNQLLPAAGTTDGQMGCVTIPFFGVPIKVCWEFEDFALDFPKVSMAIRLTAGVGDQQYLFTTLHIECENITDPSGCRIRLSGDKSARLSPSCDWGCVASCAPGCVGCGTNYWCWAGCAIRCVWQCCGM